MRLNFNPTNQNLSHILSHTITTYTQWGKEFYNIHARFCKAMAHPTRLRLLDLLKTRDKSVNELAAELRVSQANLSQHLSILREIGVVKARRVGMNVQYSVTSPKIIEACALVKKIVSENAEKQNRVLFGKPSEK